MLLALIDRAVAHQLDDPQLAAIIAAEQARLPLDEEDAALRGGIVALVATHPRPARPGAARPPRSRRSTCSASRGPLDTAALEGKRDAGPVRRRLERAAFGYLGIGARGP